jgi:hypothetical protein
VESASSGAPALRGLACEFDSHGPSPPKLHPFWGVRASMSQSNDSSICCLWVKFKYWRRNLSQAGQHIRGDPGRRFTCKWPKAPGGLAAAGKEKFQSQSNCISANPGRFSGLLLRLSGPLVHFRLLIGHTRSKMGEQLWPWLRLAAL